MDAEAASNIQASDDDEDKNQALRSIQNAYSQLLVELSESVQTGNGTTASNELISDDTNIIINLSLPSNYPLALKDALRNVLKRFISDVSGVDGTITWKLEMPSRFDDNLLSSINSSVNSFLVNSIIGKWCEITANDKVKEYADNAAALLLDIKEKAFFKKKPTRTKIS